jgi:hypothetical protein
MSIASHSATCNFSAAAKRQREAATHPVPEIAKGPAVPEEGYILDEIADSVFWVSDGAGSYASFSDPDGNGWLLQGITQRLPGRVRPMDVEALAQLLHETAEHHDPYEKASAPHDWWDWYAAYFEARQAGSTQDEASEIAGRYMADVKQVFAADAYASPPWRPVDPPRRGLLFPPIVRRSPCAPPTSVPPTTAGAPTRGPGLGPTSASTAVRSVTAG